MVKASRNIKLGILIGMILAVALTYNSCTYDKGAAPNGCDTTQYTYTKAGIDTIIQTYCSIQACHDGSDKHSSKGGVILTTYQEVKNKVDDGRIEARMISADNPNAMPPPTTVGKLPDSTLAKVQQWLSEGACE
tara:strand:- start:123 stop:524 length:402 start_codon:yes stop_codon:yes gene_type:complete